MMAQAFQQQQIVKTEHAGFFGWDVRNDRVFADKAFAELFGMSECGTETGLCLKVYVDRIHPDDRANFLNAIRISISMRTPFQECYRVVKPDGSVQHILDFAQPFFDGDGVPVFYSGLVVPMPVENEEPDALLAHGIIAYEHAHIEHRTLSKSRLSSVQATLVAAANAPSNDNQ